MAKKKRITQEDAVQIRTHLAEIDSILKKYEDYDYKHVTAFSRMFNGFIQFKEWFGYWATEK